MKLNRISFGKYIVDLWRMWFIEVISRWVNSSEMKQNQKLNTQHKSFCAAYSLKMDTTVAHSPPVCVGCHEY